MCKNGTLLKDDTLIYVLNTKCHSYYLWLLLVQYFALKLFTRSIVLISVSCHFFSSWFKSVSIVFISASVVAKSNGARA